MTELARIIPFSREQPLTPEHRAHLIQRMADLAMEADEHEMEALVSRSEEARLRAVLGDRA